MNDQPRLNILRLPSQTVTVVVLIALVLIGGLAALSAGRSDNIFLLLALGLLVISLRRLLTWPDEERILNRLAPAEGEFVQLQQRITTLAARICLPRSPILLIAPGDYDVRVFGGWRRWYIGMDQQRAQAFLKLAGDPENARQVDAVLMHELFHFRNRDNFWMEFARALLRNGLALILWFGMLIFGMIWLAGMARQSFFTSYSPDQLGAIFEQMLPGLGGNDLAHSLFGSQKEFEQLREQALGVNFVQALLNFAFNMLPFLLFGSILLLAFWRRFMRLREIYADAGAVQSLGEIRSLTDAVQSASRSAEETSLHIDAWLRDTWGRLWSRYFNSSPPILERINYLHHPELIYGSAWRYGWLIGLFVNFLNLELLSTAALSVIGDWPLHIPAVAGLILISLYVLPSLAMGSNTRVTRDSVIMIGLIAGIYGAVVVLALVMIMFWALVKPSYVGAVFNLAAKTASWYSGNAAALDIGDPWSFLPVIAFVNLLQVPTLALVIAVPVVALTALIRRMLTWYGLPRAKHRLMKAVVVLILLVAALSAFVVLPPLTNLITFWKNGMMSLASRWYWAGVLLTLASCGTFTVWFVSQDRRYAGRCPRCKEHIPGPFALGKRCPQCQQPLHRWLEAHYSVEAQQ